MASGFFSSTFSLASSAFFFFSFFWSALSIEVYDKYEKYGQELEDCFVFDAVLCLELGGVNRQTGYGYGSALEQHHCDLELSDELTLLLSEDGVCVQQVVLQAFGDTELGSDFVFERVQAETKGWEAGLNFSEEGSSVVGLESIVSFKRTLVNCASEFALNWKTAVLLWLFLHRS